MFKQWIAGLLALWSVGAWAEDQLCAVVLIEIAQELTLERQAFEATMRINNGLDTIALDSLQVQVLFADDQGNVIKASSDPNATDAAFFIRLDDSQNVSSVQTGAEGSVTNGSVPAATAGVLRWLIIPTAGAAGDSLTGKRYSVGASLSYNAGGKVESVTVTPDTITVKPQPQLTLDYFLTREVTADDAFTPEIEPPVPYTLGVRIRNSGKGDASSVKLESAQPRIIDNELGLAVNFQITHGFVDEAAAAPTLLLDFGQILPGTNRMGRWLMESTLSGKFVDFTASFSHPDELGGRLTSLIDAVNARLLVRDVMVDLVTRDRVRDYLAFVGADLYVFESDNTSQTASAPCFDCTLVNSLTGSLSGSSTLRTLNVTTQAGFGYVKVPDPYGGTKGLMRVTRSNGQALSPYNAWLSKERAPDGRAFNYYINVFDAQPVAQYAVEFGELTQEPKPPVFLAVSDRSAHEGGQLGFLMRASDPNGTVPRLYAEGLPSGATFKDDGQGRGTFYWEPLQGQAGRYTVTFKATDGLLEGSLPVGIQIFRAGDSDGDGMDDDWELLHFGNLDRDGTGDLDGDGVSDLEEFQGKSDPNVADATPLPPELYDPLDNAEVTDFYPPLRVRNSPTRLSGQTLSYWFEVYADEGLTQLVAKSAAVTEGTSTTEWILKADQLQPDVIMLDNHRYYWRVRVSHDKGASEWLNGRFFINTANDAPTAPVLLSPTPFGLVADSRPTFRFNNSADVDEDAVTYRVRVFSEADESFSLPVAEITGLLPGADGVTVWQSPVELEENYFYFWIVEAQDAHGASTPSEPSLFGVSLTNQAPSAPGLAWPLNGQQISQATGVVLKLDAATDPERQALKYRIQVDTSELFDSGAVLDSGWFTGDTGSIAWTVPAELEENRIYHWRAQSSDGELESAWVAGRFQINQLPEAPAVPVASNPGDGAWVEVISPTLTLHPAADPEGDAVSYEFEMYDEQGLEPLATVAGAGLQWTPQATLLDNSWYRWRARAVDATGMASAWGGLQRFFVNENGTDDAPTFTFIQPSQEVAQQGGSVLIQWTDSDPDSAATIDLYANDLLIASGLSEDLDGDADRFEWSLVGLEWGTYSLKAIIRDGSNQITANACCTVTLLPPTPEITVTPLGTTTLDEFGEAVAEVEVSLSRGPRAGQSATINLALTDSSEARLLNDPPYLYFTSDNWEQPQRIRVRGIDDCEIDGAQQVGLELLPLRSSDADFEGLDPQDVLLSTNDNEVTGQTLFLCHYQVVARGEVGSDGLVDITVRPELLNQGAPLASASASAYLQGDDATLPSGAAVTFGQALTGIRSPALETLTIRQQASEQVLFNRLHWTITPGPEATVTEPDGSGSVKTGNGGDILQGTAGNDQLSGGNGDDVLIGGGGEDTLNGGGGNDTFIVEGNSASPSYYIGGTGEDRILGGEGDDVIRVTKFGGTYHVESIDGGAGSNRIEGTPSADDLDFSSTTLQNIESINGLGGDDRIVGSQGNDVILGGAGNDELLGEGGNDRFLVAGVNGGFDRVSGGAGVDEIVGSDADDHMGLSYYGDVYTVERIDGGAGVDVILGDSSANTFDFSTTTLVSVERIEGGAGDDVIIGTAFADTIMGGPGDDKLQGGDGDDLFLLSGVDSGWDEYAGGSGYDRILGGAGDDTLLLSAFSAANSIEEIDGNGGQNAIRGTSRADTLDFSSVRLQAISVIEGLGGSDQLIGSADADTLAGGAGNDYLSGRAGADRYLFDGGRDLIEDLGIAGEQNQVLLQVPVVPSQIWLEQNGNNLVLLFEGYTDRLTIVDWFTKPANRIAQFALPDGAYLAEGKVDGLMAVMNTVSSNSKKRKDAEQALLDAALAEAWVLP